MILNPSLPAPGTGVGESRRIVLPPSAIQERDSEQVLKVGNLNTEPGTKEAIGRVTTCQKNSALERQELEAKRGHTG
jgi:hypothetical protein